MKNYEKMSIEELISEMSKINKKNNFQPKKFKSDENGIILLDPKNETIENGMKMIKNMMLYKNFAS